LPDDVGALKSIIDEKSAQLRDRDLRIAVLEEQLRLEAHKRYGASSEKSASDQLGLFNEADSLVGAPAADEDTSPANNAITIPEHTRTKGGCKPFPSDMPRERVEHDVAKAERMCACGSGHQRPRIGEVVTEQSDIDSTGLRW
jgi:transposase